MKIQTIKLKDCTIGVLTVGGFRCHTLELPWLDNKRRVSCIPAGTYEYSKHVSPSQGPCLSIKNVVGRTHILIHKGNFTRNVLGCIAVGESIVDIDKDGIPDVTSSVKTLDALLDAVPESGTVEITRCD